MAMRGQLKLVEHVAEGLGQQVNKEMSDRERKIREEYELKMKRLVFSYITVLLMIFILCQGACREGRESSQRGGGKETSGRKGGEEER